ncbi:MAG: protein-L-isoaspartate(D-aspartate) O-methyltransferase [Desulfohalobiaceae bacterium]
MKASRAAFFFTALAVLLVSVSVCAQDADWAQQRRRMVQRQIEGRGIDDPHVLRAMEKVRRHLFVPEGFRSAAYDDRPLPIGQGQTISQPYIVALMTELAEVRSGDRVLEVGTGSGYQAAVLAELAESVYTVEIVEELAKTARNRLDKLGYDNVHVRMGDGFRGWPEHAPFDAVVVTAAPPEIPGPLKEQLAPGGRLVIPVGKGWQELKVVEKAADGTLKKTTVIPVQFVPMTGPGVEKMKNDSSR